MKYDIVAQTSIEAREIAKSLAKREVYISAIYFVRGRPDVRAFVFSTELL